MEVQTQRSPVAIVVAVKVVTQKTGELLAGRHVGAGVHHVTTGKGLVEGGVITTIQLVHHHLPDGVATGRAVVGVAVALVGHAEVQGVWPDGNPAEGGRDGGIVHEELVGHHLELLVAAHAQVGSPHADDGAVGDVGETLNNQPGAGHLSQPIVVAAAGPVVGVILVRQREHGDLVATAVQILHGRVVGVLMGDEEGALDGAAVGVLALAVEDVLVQINVVHIDGTVEGDGHHLGHLLGFDAAGDAGSISRAEAIGQGALGGVALGGAVGILIDGCLWRK